jgi:hypothetical protein
VAKAIEQVFLISAPSSPTVILLSQSVYDIFLLHAIIKSLTCAMKQFGEQNKYLSILTVVVMTSHRAILLYLLVALMLNVSVAPSSALARSGLATKYKPAGIKGGYKDKLISPNMWEIAAAANGFSERDLAQNMAIFRAAEVVQNAGFTHIQIVNQKGKSREFSGIGGFAGANLKLTVIGTNSPDPPTECKAKNPDACYTVSVEEIIVRVRPLIPFPKDKTDKETDKENE